MTATGRASDESAYPKRPPYFAHRVVRMLFKTCAAQTIGQTGTLLVMFVAHTEDAKRYTSPPTFYNDQLLPILGLRKWESLDRARRAAVDGGWLHYEAPPSGTRKAGVYWTTIPCGFDSIDDTPIGEEHHPTNGDGQEEAYPPDGYGEGDGRGYGRGDGRGELPYLRPRPIPKKESAPEGGNDESLPSEELLDQLVAYWNGLPRGTVPKVRNTRGDAIAKGWRAVQRDKEAREHFADPGAVIEAIRGSPFLHGQGWFRLPWLFAKGQSREWNICKLMEGAYRENGNGHSKTLRQDADPTRIRTRYGGAGQTETTSSA